MQNPNLQSETSEHCRKTNILRKPTFSEKFPRTPYPVAKHAEGTPKPPRHVPAADAIRRVCPAVPEEVFNRPISSGLKRWIKKKKNREIRIYKKFSLNFGFPKFWPLDAGFGLF